MLSAINTHFIKHYKDLLESFHFYFQKSLQNPEIEDLHNIRVSIKKLRAMWSLFETVSKGNWKKTDHFSLFSRLFKATGVVRETQVNLILLERYNVNYFDTYAGHLHELQEKANKLFFKEMMRFSIDNLDRLNNTLFQELNNQSNTMTLEQLLSFVLKKKKKVFRLTKKLPDNRKLHKIRINLKAVSEILTIANDLNTNTELDEFLNKVNWLNEQIGDWHDFEVLLNSIKKFIKKNQKKKQLLDLENFMVRTEEWQNKKQEEIKTLLIGSLSGKQQERFI
jgi:CHAD domain-containing protein